MRTIHTFRRRRAGKSLRKGFTLIEGMLVVAVLAVVAGASMPAYRTYQIRSDLDLATEAVVQSLRRAQTLAKAGQDDTPWGVYVQEGTLFAGDSYALRNPSHDEMYVIPTTVDAYGLREVVYARLSGIPYETGSIYLVALNGEYREIVIEEDGQLFAGGVQPHDPNFFQEEEEEEEEDEEEPEEQYYEYDDEWDDFDTIPLEQCERGFMIKDDVVYTLGSGDVTMTVIGSAATYGANGPAMQMRISASLNNGETWMDLFGGNPISAGMTHTFENLPQGTPMLLRFNGRYSWLFNKTFQSNDGTGHVYVLQDGDPAPDYPILQRVPSMAVFLRSIVHHVHRIVKVHQKDVLFLVEMGNLDNTADFQDAAVIFSSKQKPHTCSKPTDPRVRINLLRRENIGEGNVTDTLYGGPQAIAFSEQQWIPLKVNGQTVIDDGIVEDVPGLAFERGPGWIRIHHHGSHDSSLSRQIVDAHVLFHNAHITSVVNAEGVNATENPTDGIINDGPNGDEFVGGPTPHSMVFVTRVSQSNDSVYLYWSEGSPPPNSGPAPGTTQNPVVQQPSDPDGGGGEDGDDGGEDGGTTPPGDDPSGPEDPVDPATPIDPEDDSCFVPFTVHADGRIVLDESADVRVRVLGSYGTYGYLGPELQVRMQMSFNNGTTIEPLFNYRRLLGDEQVAFRDVPAGSVIIAEFNGRYTWLFNRTERSGKSSPHVRVLVRGDAAPDTPLIQALTPLRPFLRSILSSSRTMNIGNREVAYLVELGAIDNMADFQDAVVILSFDKPSERGTCAPMTGEVVTQIPGTGQGGEGDPDDPGAPGATLADLDGDGIPDVDDICPGTYMPESVPEEYMLFGRYALTANSTVFRVGPRREISKYTLSDTRGCSCGQILDAIEGKNTYRFDEFPVLLRQMRSLFSFYVQSSRKFGCGEALMEMVSRGL